MAMRGMTVRNNDEMIESVVSKETERNENKSNEGERNANTSNEGERDGNDNRSVPPERCRYACVGLALPGTQRRQRETQGKNVAPDLSTPKNVTQAYARKSCYEHACPARAFQHAALPLL
jgi:hypothetical protein